MEKKKMHKLNYLSAAIAVVMLLSAAVPLSPLAYPNPAAVDLLTVENFDALASTAVSSPTGGTVLNNGDLGIVGIGCTDFPLPCQTPGVNGVVIGGAIQNNNAVALTAQTDSTAVVTDLNLRLADQTIAGGLLDGLTLDAGVYDVPAAVTNLTGDLTLRGDADSIFIFRFASTFITAGTSRVLFTGGAQACNVYWTAVSGVTFNGATQMAGSVFAGTSVTFPGGGAVVNGRVIAQTAAITFNNTTINNSPCAPAPAPTATVDNRERRATQQAAGVLGVGGLPDTGGASIRNDEFPVSLVMVAGFGAITLFLGIQAYRRTRLPKQ